MDLSRNQLEHIVCIACGRRFIEHTKPRSKKFNLPELLRCMLRIQATIVAEADKKRSETESRPGSLVYHHVQNN